MKTDLWLKMIRAGKVREHQADLALSILHSRGRKSLDILASDMETRDIWVKGLQMLINETFGTRYRKITDRWLEGLFNEADRNRNGLLCEREVHQLLLKLNVRLTQEEFDQYFEVTKRNVKVKRNRSSAFVFRKAI